MTARDAAVAQITRRCHAGLDSSALLEELLDGLRRAIPFDAGLVASTDPATLLYTGAALADDSHVTYLPGFLANEYLDEDVMKYADLASGRRRVDWLTRSTRGRPDSSSRYRQLLAPMGLGDELRAAFVAGGCCWGVACLTREHGSIAFNEDDARLISQLAPHIAEGIRKALLLSEAGGAGSHPGGPGVLVLAADLSVTAATPAAEAWLAEIASDHEPLLNGLPASVVNAVAALRSIDVSSERPTPQPRVRVRARTGRWVTLHASYLAAQDDERHVAVVLEPAERADMAPLMLQAYGLTPKESEVSRLVLLGNSTKQVAAALFISEHTVQDHFKSIFNKVGVGSRRELVTRMLSDQYPGFTGSEDVLDS